MRQNPKSFGSFPPLSNPFLLSTVEQALYIKSRICQIFLDTHGKGAFHPRPPLIFPWLFALSVCSVGTFDNSPAIYRRGTDYSTKSLTYSKQTLTKQEPILTNESPLPKVKFKRSKQASQTSSSRSQICKVKLLPPNPIFRGNIKTNIALEMGFGICSSQNSVSKKTNCPMFNFKSIPFTN